MKVQTKEQIFRLFEKNKDIVQSFGIEKVGLFGSFVKRRQKGKSDIDLLIKFAKEKKTYRNFINFVYFIENLLGRKVEVITPESLSPYIAPYIEKEVEYVQISG